MIHLNHQMDHIGTLFWVHYQKTGNSDWKSSNKNKTKS